MLAGHQRTSLALFAHGSIAVLLRTLRALVRSSPTVPLGEESSAEILVSSPHLSDGADPSHQHEIEPGELFRELHHRLLER